MTKGIDKLGQMAFFTGLLGAAGVSCAAPRPNIIYILTDDVGWGDVGFNGQQRFTTPNIDKLAERGAILRNYYTSSPVCGPARVSLMTGLHTGHSPIRGNPRWSTTSEAQSLAEGTVTVATELKRAGYATLCLGKWGLNDNLQLNTGHPLKQGFDEFLGYNTHGEAHFHWPDFLWHNHEKIDLGGESNWLEKRTYANDLFTERAVEYIAEAGEQPFFIYLNYTITHLGISVPEESQLPFRDLGWPKRPMPTTGRYRHDRDGNVSYAGMMWRLDGYMKQLVEALRERGLEENTLIIFSSDNGPEFDDGFFNSNGIFSGGKRDLLEGGIRMPAFAYWPAGIPAGTEMEHISAFWDILPTLCELAGIEPSVEHDGISFVPALTGRPEEQEAHEYLYWEFNERRGPMQAVRFGPWKAMRFWNREEDRFDAVQLFHLERDPSEQIDVASHFPELADRAVRYMSSTRTEHPLYPLEFLTDAYYRRR